MRKEERERNKEKAKIQVLKIGCATKVSLKWAIPGLFLLMFCLYNAVNSIMVNVLCQNCGLLESNSGKERDRSANCCATTSAQKFVQYILGFKIVVCRCRSMETSLLVSSAPTA